jgi:predicted RNase H-like nuclease
MSFCFDDPSKLFVLKVYKTVALNQLEQLPRKTQFIMDKHTKTDANVTDSKLQNYIDPIEIVRFYLVEIVI